MPLWNAAIKHIIYLLLLCIPLIFLPPSEAKYAAILHMDVIAHHAHLRQYLTNPKSILRRYFPVCLGRNRLIIKGIKKHMAKNNRIAERPLIIPAIR